MVEGELVQSKKSFMGMPVRSQCPEHKKPENIAPWRSIVLAIYELYRTCYSFNAWICVCFSPSYWSPSARCFCHERFSWLTPCDNRASSWIFWVRNAFSNARRVSHGGAREDVYSTTCVFRVGYKGSRSLIDLYSGWCFCRRLENSCCANWTCQAPHSKSGKPPWFAMWSCKARISLSHDSIHFSLSTPVKHCKISRRSDHNGPVWFFESMYFLASMPRIIHLLRKFFPLMILSTPRMKCLRLAAWTANMMASPSAFPVLLRMKALHLYGEVTPPTLSGIFPPRLLTSRSATPTSQCSPTRRTVTDMESGWWETWHLVV